VSKQFTFGVSTADKRAFELDALRPCGSDHYKLDTALIVIVN